MTQTTTTYDIELADGRQLSRLTFTYPSGDEGIEAENAIVLAIREALRLAVRGDKYCYLGHPDAILRVRRRVYP